VVAPGDGAGVEEPAVRLRILRNAKYWDQSLLATFGTGEYSRTVRRGAKGKPRTGTVSTTLLVDWILNVFHGFVFAQGHRHHQRVTIYTDRLLVYHRRNSTCPFITDHPEHARTSSHPGSPSQLQVAGRRNCCHGSPAGNGKSAPTAQPVQCPSL
jgi:hypothetical protein